MLKCRMRMGTLFRVRSKHCIVKKYKYSSILSDKPDRDSKHCNSTRRQALSPYCHLIPQAGRSNDRRTRVKPGG